MTITSYPFDLVNAEVRQFPYRSARVFDRFLELDRDEMKRYEEKLAELAGSPRDNHTAYAITKNGKTVYVSCSDFAMSFGLSLEERSF